MAIRFIVDSASDMTVEECRELGIIRLAQHISFGDETFIDGVTINTQMFYERLIESDTLPKTSLVTISAFDEAFRQVVEAGDSAIVFVVSSKLSGTYQSAMIAAQEYEGKIFVIDTLNVCIGQRILLQLAMQYVKHGMCIREIVDRINAERDNVQVIALLDTLEYLKKGGRISAAVALAGSLLSIKPVVSLIDGEVAMVGKARGSKQANNLLRELINKSGVDFDKPFALAYSGLSDHMLQKYIEDSADLWKNHAETLPVSMVGCTIGTHAGPGAIAVAFFKKI